jgi:hypothetical protein
MPTIGHERASADRDPGSAVVGRVFEPRARAHPRGHSACARRESICGYQPAILLRRLDQHRGQMARALHRARILRDHRRPDAHRIGSGERHDVRAGDAFVVPAGFEGTWEVTEPSKNGTRSSSRSPESRHCARSASGGLANDLCKDLDDALDLRRLDDQRRRQRDRIGGLAHHDTPFEALDEHVEGARPGLPARGSKSTAPMRPKLRMSMICGSPFKECIAFPTAARACSRASASSPWHRCRASRAPRRRRPDAPSRYSRETARRHSPGPA